MGKNTNGNISQEISPLYGQSHNPTDITKYSTNNDEQMNTSDFQNKFKIVAETRGGYSHSIVV